MKFKAITMFALAATLFHAPLAAQPRSKISGDQDVQIAALKECFANSSTGRDRITLAQWVVAIMAKAPSVQGVVTIGPDVKDKLDIGVARIFTRLITQDCVAESRPLWKTRSSEAFKVAGETLGRLAMQEIMNGDGQAKMFSGYASHIDPADFKVLEQ